MVKKKILIVANWKMNPETHQAADKLFKESVAAARQAKQAKIVLCMPYTWLTDFSKKGKSAVSFGAQNASVEEKGSFTGEVSPKMLTSSGVEYVILGHSERRAMGESDDLIAKKVLSSLRAGLRVILCIGEKERDTHGEFLMFLRDQLMISLGKIQKKYLKKLIIAYEPIWAIGKSEDQAMKPGDLHETSLFIKKVLAEIYGQPTAMGISVIYGGAVSAKNAKDLLVLGEVNGLLVGHESLNPKKFKDLLSAVS